MQEKESPLPTQVPPFTQGLGTQLLFLAAGRERKPLVMPGESPIWLEQAAPGLGEAASLGRVLTNGAGAALPAWRARAAEGVAAVIARATVAAGVGITLELACKHMVAQRVGHIDHSRVLAGGPSICSFAGTPGTYVSGRSCPSNHHHRHSRSH